MTQHGYVLVRSVGHHLADVRGYAYEHRLVAEKILGRALLPEERVHHKNGDRGDNHPSNIEICDSTAHHHLLHRKEGSNRRLPGQENSVVSCECGCGTKFLKFGPWNRPRRFVSGHNLPAAK